MRLADDGGAGVEQKPPSAATFIYGDVEQAVTKIGVGTHLEIDCVTRDIADEEKGWLVADQFAVGDYVQVWETMLPEGAADGPNVVGVGDMADAKAVDAFYDFGVETDAGDRHEMGVTCQPEVKIVDDAVVECSQGDAVGAVEANFTGKEVFRAGGNDQQWHGRAGHALCDRANRAVTTGYDKGGEVEFVASAGGQFCGVLERTSQVNTNSATSAAECVEEMANAGYVDG